MVLIVRNKAFNLVFGPFSRITYTARVSTLKLLHSSLFICTRPYFLSLIDSFCHQTCQ